MPSDAERAVWRAANADLIEYISTPANQRASRFIGNMYQSFQQWNSLTDAQTRATRNVMRELTEGAAPIGADDPNAPALATEVPHIFNGTYTINDGSEHLTFQIYTPRRGSLQGKRIIKRQLSYGEFKGFAFLTHSGGVKVWRSHYEDEARNERYIVWARLLVAALNERGQDGQEVDDTDFEFTYAEGTGYTVQASIFCRRCNRPLTDPTSIRLGIGPDCRNLEVAPTTTAAAPHEPVITGSNITAANLSMSSIITQDSDQILSVQPVANGEAESVETATSGETPEPPNSAEQHLINRVNEARQQTRSWGPYGQQACQYCGRNDFQSPQGRGRHISSCRRSYRQATLIDRAQMRLAQFRQRNNIVRNDGLARDITPTAVRTVRPSIRPRAMSSRPAPGPRQPNLSALGTVIGGSVWEQ